MTELIINKIKKFKAYVREIAINYKGCIKHATTADNTNIGNSSLLFCGLIHTFVLAVYTKLFLIREFLLDCCRTVKDNTFSISDPIFSFVSIFKKKRFEMN